MEDRGEGVLGDAVEARGAGVNCDPCHFREGTLFIFLIYFSFSLQRGCELHNNNNCSSDTVDLDDHNSQESSLPQVC